MPTPNEKLAESLAVLKELQSGGRRVFRSDDRQHPLAALVDFHDRSVSRGKSSLRGAREERGSNLFGSFSASCWPLGRGFYSRIEPDIHWLAQLVWLPNKIEFVFACQSRNKSTGASGACVPVPSRQKGETWQATR